MFGPYIQQLKHTQLAPLAADERQLWADARGLADAATDLDEAHAAGLSRFLSDLGDDSAAGAASNLSSAWPRQILEILPMHWLLTMRHQAILGSLDRHATAPDAVVAIAQALAARFGELHAQAHHHQAHERFATLAHDLRTPLTAISGALNVLKRTMGTHAPGETPRMVELAITNASRLVRQVDQLLEAEAERANPEPPRTRVVIVDADPAIRLVMQSVLEHQGCQVLALPVLESVPDTGATGEPWAVFFVEASQVVAACAMLAAHPATAGAPVVALGHVLEHEGEPLGCQVVSRLAKPFKAASLLEALDAALDGRAPRMGELP